MSALANLWSLSRSRHNIVLTKVEHVYNSNAQEGVLNMLQSKVVLLLQWIRQARTQQVNRGSRLLRKHARAIYFIFYDCQNHNLQVKNCDIFLIFA